MGAKETFLYIFLHFPLILNIFRRLLRLHLIFHLTGGCRWRCDLMVVRFIGIGIRIVNGLEMWEIELEKRYFSN